MKKLTTKQLQRRLRKNWLAQAGKKYRRRPNRIQYGYNTLK